MSRTCPGHLLQAPYARSPLHEAASAGDSPAVLSLLASGSDPNRGVWLGSCGLLLSEDMSGTCPGHVHKVSGSALAACCTLPRLSPRRLQAGTAAEAEGRGSRRTLERNWASGGHAAVAEALLASGADPSLQRPPRLEKRV